MNTKPSFSSAPAQHVSQRSRSSVPTPDELERGLKEFDQAVEKISREREEMNCGSRIASAVRARLQPRFSATASAARTVRARGFSAAATSGGGNDDSFAEKLRRAVEKKSPRKRHEEFVQRERNRYTRKPRPHTKSD
jgi:hypothetical protein